MTKPTGTLVEKAMTQPTGTLAEHFPSMHDLASTSSNDAGALLSLPVP